MHLRLHHRLEIHHHLHDRRMNLLYQQHHRLDVQLLALLVRDVTAAAKGSGGDEHAAAHAQRRVKKLAELLDRACAVCRSNWRLFDVCAVFRIETGQLDKALDNRLKQCRTLQVRAHSRRVLCSLAARLLHACM